MPIVGPVIGGIAGGLFYRYVFIEGSPLALAIALLVILACLAIEFIFAKRWAKLHPTSPKISKTGTPGTSESPGKE